MIAMPRVLGLTIKHLPWTVRYISDNGVFLLTRDQDQMIKDALAAQDDKHGGQLDEMPLHMNYWSRAFIINSLPSFNSDRTRADHCEEIFCIDDADFFIRACELLCGFTPLFLPCNGLMVSVLHSAEFEKCYEHVFEPVEFECA